MDIEGQLTTGLACLFIGVIFVVFICDCENFTFGLITFFVTLICLPMSIGGGLFAGAAIGFAIPFWVVGYSKYRDEKEYEEK